MSKEIYLGSWEPSKEPTEQGRKFALWGLRDKMTRDGFLEMGEISFSIDGERPGPEYFHVYRTVIK